MANKNYFEPVDLKVDFPAQERALLDHWYKKGIVKKYLTKNRNSKKYFSFLDGPITANGPMGVHHAWGRTYKDLWPRFKNMQGYKQRFQNGFDCQGLWVEVEVEKELGLKSKKDIENLVPGDAKASIAKFVDLCKERVYKFAKIQTEQSKRLGYFADWDNSYYTLSAENNYMIWHFLKKCHEHGLIYKGRDSVPWCPRCGTAISQHEMLTEDYKEAVHGAFYVSYPLEKKKDEFLLIWTTTPWTLPANVAVAADPDKTYVLAVGADGRKYYLFENKAKKLGFKVIKKLKGEKLIGLNYRSPFDNLERVRKAMGADRHRVVAADARILVVSEEEGTGLVHIATGAGSEDFALGKKEGLWVIDVIDEGAFYFDGLGALSSKNAKDHPEIIGDWLKTSGNLLAQEKYSHRYPACWRCRTELVWRAVDEWYIAMDPLRESMKSLAKKINWIPSFGLKRELDWLNNMHDWLISKKRYWGLALPIWECLSCGHFDVIGSREELKEKAADGWEKFEGHSPHRPWIDEVKVKCSKCGKIAERIPDVGNPWLDAGIVPFSTVSSDNKSESLYNFNKQPRAKSPRFSRIGSKSLFTALLHPWPDRPRFSQSLNKKEFEKWYPADFITESFPGQFKNWFYSLLAMSSVLENREPFKTVLGFATMVDQLGRGFHKSLGNAIEFVEGADKAGADVIRWMCARQNPAENLQFGYELADETRRKFHLKLWNIYNFFVAYANLDGWSPTRIGLRPGGVPSEKQNILDKWILSRLSQTEKEVTNSLERFDAYAASGFIEKFVDDFSLWYIRRSRGRVDRDDFYTTTHFALVTLSKLLAPFNPFLSEVIFRNLTKKESVHLEDWPVVDRKLIDPDLEREMDEIRGVAERGHALRKEAKVSVRQALAKVAVTEKAPKIPGLEGLVKDELNVLEVEWGAKKDELDLAITPKLRAMGEAREIIRCIQEERKKLGTVLDAWVNVTLPKWPKKFEGEIKTKARVKNLKKGEFKVE